MRRKCKVFSTRIGAATQVAPIHIIIDEISKSQISAKNKHNNTTTQHFIIKYIKNAFVIMYIRLNFNYIFKLFISVAFCCFCCVCVVFMLCFTPICCVLNPIFGICSLLGETLKKRLQKSKHNKIHDFSAKHNRILAKHNARNKKSKISKPLSINGFTILQAYSILIIACCCCVVFKNTTNRKNTSIAIIDLNINFDKIKSR